MTRYLTLVETAGERIYQEICSTQGYSDAATPIARRHAEIVFDTIKASGINIDVIANSDNPHNLSPQLTFQESLKRLINYYSMENGSNTPDFLLAEFLGMQLSVFNNTVTKREKWYGRDPQVLAQASQQLQPVDGSGETLSPVQKATDTSTEA